MTITLLKMSLIVYNIPDEILELIFSYLDSKDLINLKSSCFRFKNLISDSKLNIKICYILYNTDIELFNKYVPKYRNIKIYNANDKHLDSLGKKGVHTIDLCYTSITDEGVKHLATKGVHNIDLSFCKNITDKSLEFLGVKGVHSINLGWCKNITDKGLKALSVKGLSFINLCNCQGITDDGIKHLIKKGLKGIDLSYCFQVSNEMRDILEEKRINVIG